MRKYDFRAFFKNVSEIGDIVVIFRSIEKNGEKKIKILSKLFGKKVELVKLQKKVNKKAGREWFTIK